MLLIISGILFFLILILIAIRFIGRQRPEEEQKSTPIINTSGIYSIVRKSPRDTIQGYKPSEKELSQYLNTQNVDILKNLLTNSDKNLLVSLWKSNLERSINEIEEGDKKGIEFYYYDFEGVDTVCNKYIKKGNYIQRRDIFSNPQIIPPFHIGCKCILKSHTFSVEPDCNRDSLMNPFICNNKIPALPEWTDILKI